MTNLFFHFIIASFLIIMIYTFTLQQVAIALGIWSLLSHGWALCQPQLCKKWLLAMPRNYPLGGILMASCGLWFCWLIFNVDLMDFAQYQTIFLIATIALTLGMIIFVREFLAVRALGVLLLLLANVLLDAAFLESHYSKFVITVTAYIYIIIGMVFVASPYQLRNFLTWFYRTEQRVKLGTLAGAFFGIILLLLGIFVY